MSRMFPPFLLLAMLLAIAVLLLAVKLLPVPKIWKTQATDVTFVVLETPDWRLLSKALSAFERERHLALEFLSSNLQVAKETEETYGFPGILSTKIQEKIDRLAHLFEQDQAVLTEVLTPFPFTKVLPSSEDYTVLNNLTFPLKVINKGTDPVFYRDKSKFGGKDQLSASYDTLVQVMAHLVRDWSMDGQHIRDSLYKWCTRQVQRHVKLGGSILVPGAGMGRLAWEIANRGYHVHAVEQSLVMCAAAAHVLTRNDHTKKKSGSSTTVMQLHPYASDMFTNEIDSKQRYRAVTIPHHSTTTALSSSSSSSSSYFVWKRRGGSLSFTVGDFVAVTTHLPPRHHRAVVTCFFLDTATNVLDYIRVIAHTLDEVGGVWINVGPLQWHMNAQLQITTNDLYALLVSFGFEILEWSIDKKPVEYRSDTRSTHYDAYCPLRFVAKRPR